MYVADVTTECDLKLILTSGSYAGYALGRVIILVSLLRYAKAGDEVLGCNYILWGYPNLCKPEKLLQVVTNCTKQNHAQYKPTEYIGRNMMETVCLCAYVFIQRTHTHIYIYIYILLLLFIFITIIIISFFIIITIIIFTIIIIIITIITIIIIIIIILILLLIIIIYIIHTYACQFNLQSYRQF